MFDMLTRDELFELHRSLSSASHAIHARMMIDSVTPRIPVLGEEWAILAAHCAELNEMAEEAHAEYQAREAEAIDA